MAIEAYDVGRVAIKGVQVSESINKFIAGFRVENIVEETGNLASASQAAGKSVPVEKGGFRSASEAVKWGKAAQASAIAAVANVVVNNVGLDRDAARGASSAINAIYLLYACAYMGPWGIALAAVGTILSFTGVLGGSPPDVYWEGKVSISFNEKYPYRYSVSVQTIDQETVGDISDKVEKEFKKGVLNRINKALKKLPNENTDFVLKYVIRPPKTMTIDVDAGKATKGVEKRFSKKMGQEIQKIVKEIQKSAVELSHLHFLAALKSKDLVQKKAVDLVPQMKYKVEGAWRKEEERLAIKLMQRREYTRQIKMMLWTYFLYGIRKGSKTKNKAFYQEDINPITGTSHGTYCIFSERKKEYIEQGKGYIVGNIPTINVLPSRDLFTGEPSSRYEPRVRAKFRIGPKLEGKKIKLDLYHIKGRVYPGIWISSKNDPVNLTDSFKNALKKTTKFSNHLIGEIPEDAARYIANNLGTTDAYIKIYYGLLSKQDDVNHSFHIDTNYPEQLNAQMQDIIDHYKFWQEGYATEFKKRKKTKILNNMLPQIREGLRSQVTNLANTYADMPKAEAISGLAMKTMDKIKQEYKNAKHNIPQIKNNKSWIVGHFGQKEYDKLLSEARNHKQNLIMQYINNAGDVASQEMFNKKMDYLTITQTELDNLVNKAYSKFKAKHPDISISKDKIRQKIKQKVNIKEKIPAEKPTPPIEKPTPPIEKPTPPIEKPTPPIEKPTPPTEKPTPPTEKPTELPSQKILSKIPSAEEIPNWFGNLSNPAKISIIGGGIGILSFLLLGSEDSDKGEYLKAKKEYWESKI